MKKHYSILLITLVTLSVSAQNPAAYFRLDVKYYTEENEKYLGVSPDIRSDAPGLLGQGMRKYPRRFRFILTNKSKFLDQYEKLYPDTVKINNLYTQSLAADPLFMSYFSKLSLPFQNSNQKKMHIGLKELMLVASRFFYCESVKKDSTINAYVCVHLNGLKNAFDKDYTLIEAFCFEAIFESYKPQPQPTPFVVNFKSYIKEAERKEKHLFKDKAVYLEKIRHYCFNKMAKDKELQKALLAYYQLNKNNLPFELQLD
ncbi:hypothetical protein [Pedobacter sp. Hv1]|uniref:hypothetical protein n=1 Tax=Pedobacter sp. Hv1 TaxID=1740090 RepID=UPI0006D8C84D|nr:hypothetical protein [Pedobacter sp. Hv1]KQC02637.1 hypothetical protein AQF98_03415 [Pedobacter sp. Hv1]